MEKISTVGLGVSLTIKSSNPVASGRTLPVGEASSISLLCYLEYVTNPVQLIKTLQ
jgi:hypothetical protein